MCDESAFHKLVSRVDDLASRVDDLEKKMAVMESTQTAMRQEMKDGFASIRAQLEHIYAERTAWGEWLRENLPKVGKWLGKWSLILIGVAIGVNNIPAIIKLWSAVPK